MALKPSWGQQAVLARAISLIPDLPTLNVPSF